jgi:hypothetical protein
MKKILGLSFSKSENSALTLPSGEECRVPNLKIEAEKTEEI